MPGEKKYSIAPGRTKREEKGLSSPSLPPFSLLLPSASPRLGGSIKLTPLRKRGKLFPQQRRGDLQLHDLVGALVDAAHAYVLQVPSHAVELTIPAPAEDLYRVVGRFPGGVRGEEFCLRHAHVRFRAGVSVFGIFVAALFGVRRPFD